MIAAAGLHVNFGAVKAATVDTLAQGLQRVADSIGSKPLTDNLATLFNLLDYCYGVKDLQGTPGEVAPQIKGGFLAPFVKLLASIDELWPTSGKAGSRCRLVVSDRWKKRLKKFPIKDREIVRLASSGGPTEKTIFEALKRHVQSYTADDTDDQDTENGSLAKASYDDPSSSNGTGDHGAEQSLP